MSGRANDTVTLDEAQPAPRVRTMPAHSSDAGEPLRIATYNIHGAVGTDGKRSAARIAQVITALKADVVALQEVPLGGAASIDVLRELQDLTGMHAVPGPTLDGPDRRFGNAVLTNLPVRAVRTLDLSFGSREARGALDVDIETGHGVMRIVATHLGLSARERRAQVRLLLEAFDTPDLPVILLGDLNEWFVWGWPLRALLTRFGRRPRRARFLRAFRLLHWTACGCIRPRVSSISRWIGASPRESRRIICRSSRACCAEPVRRSQRLQARPMERRVLRLRYALHANVVRAPFGTTPAKEMTP